MTLHYEITKALHRNEWLRLCVNCREVSLLDHSEFIKYDIPDSYQNLSRNITGTICPYCFSELRK